MLAVKRQRGATAKQPGERRLTERCLPRNYLLLLGAGLALVGATALMGAFTSAPDDNALNTPQMLLTNTVSPALPSTVSAELLPTPVEQPAPELPWAVQTVGNGDNLSLIFKRAGFETGDVYSIVSSAAHGKSLERIFPGQTIAFQANEAGQLNAVRHVRSQLETVTYLRTGEGFDSEHNTRAPEAKVAWASGKISSSLFLAGQEAGLSQNTIMEMANIFGGVIDFVLDPRKGDTMHLIYEDLYLDGEKFKSGDIIAASFNNQGKTFNAYRYSDSNGEAGYYNEDGVSMRKAFLLAPVDFTRISSNFNSRRLHPIYKTRRPHRGTDYAASRGTPVFAAGDGRVLKTGYNRSNGNYVFIKHGEQFVTKYLHLNKRKVKRGQRVSQSQIIGTVGSTGSATGPHLHYEFLVNGVHRNPRTIHKKLPKAKSLPASELARFRAAIHGPATQLASLISDNQLAVSESAQPDLAQN